MTVEYSEKRTRLVVRKVLACLEDFMIDQNRIMIDWYR
jgi:hypothetical protein